MTSHDRAPDRTVQAGHLVEFLLDAGHAWQATLAALDGARRVIDGQLYCLHADAVGDAFVAALVRARGRGVVVRLVLDGLGSATTAERQLADLVGAGVLLRVFGPLRIGVPWRYWMRRNHRKVFCMDDEVALVGGRNVGDAYFAPDGVLTGRWLDAGLLVRGPLVHDVAALLRADWQGRMRAGHRRDWLWDLTPAKDRPGRRLAAAARTAHRPHAAAPPPAIPCAPCGPTRAALAVNHGALRTGLANSAYAAAVRAAQRDICLANAYFLPGRRLRLALLAASRRAVRVRILLPAFRVNDVRVAGLAMEHGLSRFLRHGAEVRLVTHTMLHAKFGVVDGDAWWTVGSANMDRLSLHRNLEANVVGQGDCAPLRAAFEQWWAQAEPWTLAKARSRPWWRKLLGWLAWQARYVL
ncbi:MAG: phosphatidylserine/phosphatidylglycerophosphate/cardiolipin synthase family protein [Deltaproteobacteria bacterium]|nr:phosphatidylserine/phosphatidylglycerophosphate/cardiolipin synthase family protein [Deltaproteobacteria bacterium]